MSKNKPKPDQAQATKPARARDQIKENSKIMNQKKKMKEKNGNSPPSLLRYQNLNFACSLGSLL